MYAKLTAISRPCTTSQAEIRDPETDVQVDPPCIWLIQIPFADDMREPRLAHSLSAKVASTVPVSNSGDDAEMQGQSVLCPSLRNPRADWLHLSHCHRRGCRQWSHCRMYQAR